MAVACTTMSCPHCGLAFSSTRGIFGQDAVLLRDAHIQICVDNPRNRCFCGAIFPNSAARDKHASTCEMNPSNRFKCPHCPQEFLNSFGMMGLISCDGKALRDAHAVGCKDNPANTCFCGNLFPNPEARNSHAVTCDKNPANHYKCQFCDADFIKTFNMFGFCSNDGRADRDAHQLCCEKNPKNICFCGIVFPNPTAREKHAATCPSNPVNRFTCSFCQRLFTTRFGMMGRIAYDGKGARDEHEVGCEKNPANVCYCGQLFLNPTARDAHAVKCEMNPANRFACMHCRKTFVSTFGLFSNNGAAERDAHMAMCMKNPSNATCSHCNRIFVNVKGPLKWFQADVQHRCERHMRSCAMNPRNRHTCERCGKCFIGGQNWLRLRDAQSERNLHQKVCDYIPCAYQVKDADFGDWLLMSSEMDGLEMSTGTAKPTAEMHCLCDMAKEGGTAQNVEYKNADYKDQLQCQRCEDCQDMGDSASTCFTEDMDQLQCQRCEDCQDMGDSASMCFTEDQDQLQCERCEDCQDMGDSASTCFHDALSSISDKSSEIDEISSTEDVEEDDEHWDIDISSLCAAPVHKKAVSVEVQSDNEVTDSNNSEQQGTIESSPSSLSGLKRQSKCRSNADSMGPRDYDQATAVEEELPIGGETPIEQETVKNMRKDEEEFSDLEDEEDAALPSGSAISICSDNTVPDETESSKPEISACAPSLIGSESLPDLCEFILEDGTAL